MIYSVHRFYSAIMDSEAMRISMPGGSRAVRIHGAGAEHAEYYAIVPAANGRAYREARDNALDAIEEAIDAGMPPGEVKIERVSL